MLLSPCFCRAVCHNPSSWQRRPATRCTAGRWCQSCCLSVTTSRTSPMEWTVCTVSTTITPKGASSRLTPASFCPQDTTVHTSCRSLMAGEEAFYMWSVCPFLEFTFIYSYLFCFTPRKNFSCLSLIPKIVGTLIMHHTNISRFFFCRVTFLYGFDSRFDAVNCKRMNVAGSQSASYLQRLLQLKYPGHLAAVTLSRVEELLHEHSYIAEDYQDGMVSFIS